MEGNKTVLDDPVTAQYTHTLTVTGKKPRAYNCAVANQISNVYAELIVEGEADFIHNMY